MATKKINLLFKDLKLKSNFVPDDSFYKSFFDESLNIVTKDSWSAISELKKKIINENTFPFIWNSMESSRVALVRELRSSQSNLSRDFKKGVAILISSEMERVFDDGLEDDYYDGFKQDCISFRVDLSNLVSNNFDYLYEVNKLSDEKDSYFARMWKDAGIRFSKDPSFYEHWWKSIKRKPGASNEKIEVISRMNSNNVYSEAILEETSKRGTKKVKRAIVEKICRDIGDIRWRMDSIKRGLKDDPSQKDLVENLSSLKERFDKLEAAIMLFADCDDREIISNMIDAVSKENLTWLIPAASKNYYLSRRIEAKIAEKNN